MLVGFGEKGVYARYFRVVYARFASPVCLNISELIWYRFQGTSLLEENGPEV